MATLDVPTLKNVKVAVETFDALHIAKDNRHLVLNRADDEVGINADKVEGILGMKVDTQIVQLDRRRRRDQRRQPDHRQRPRAPAQRRRARARHPARRPDGRASRRRGQRADDTARTRPRPRPRADSGDGASHEPRRPSRRRPRGRDDAGRGRARAALLTEDVREPGEGLPEVDHDGPGAALPRRLRRGRRQRGRRQAPRRRPDRRRERRRQRRRADDRQGPMSAHAAATAGASSASEARSAQHDQRADGQPGHRGPARAHHAERPDRGAQEQRPRPAAAADGPASLRLGHGPERARHRGPQGPRRRPRLAGPPAEQQRPRAGHPGDQRRHPGLRADRAVPARPGRLRGHGQQREPASTSRRPAG